MADEIVKVEDGAVKVALSRFGLSLRDRRSLLAEIGERQLVSVRKTFRDQGEPSGSWAPLEPSGSWAPLAPSTLRNAKSKNTPGRKILIVSGRLLNSIKAQATNGVVIGTNLVYGRVQQEGSADRAGSAIGPQARVDGRSVSVSKSSRTFTREIRYGMRTVEKNGRKHQVPVSMRVGSTEVFDKTGRKRKVKRRFEGPRLQQKVDVGEHERFQNIPARPYLVFRPEDPERIRGQVIAFVARARIAAALEGN